MWSPSSERDVVLQYDFLHGTTLDHSCPPVVAHDSVTFVHGYSWGLTTVLVLVMVWLINIIRTRKREHSRKPEECYNLIEDCSPGPYLELFARHPRKAWEQWGNEIPVNGYRGLNLRVKAINLTQVVTSR
jgi:hypothetical protein